MDLGELLRVADSRNVSRNNDGVTPERAPSPIPWPVDNTLLPSEEVVSFDPPGGPALGVVGSSVSVSGVIPGDLRQWSGWHFTKKDFGDLWQWSESGRRLKELERVEVLKMYVSILYKP
jgi:hypothetical protein